MYTAKGHLNQERQGLKCTQTPITTQYELTTAPDTTEENLPHNH